MKSVLALSILFAGTVALAAGHEVMTPEAQAVDTACASDAKTAGCGDEKVGTGLLKCMHAYKMAHKKDFKVSDGCKTAMQAAHAAKEKK